MAEEVDRLSSLPDDLIYKILSYVDIVYTVRLSVLSSRWRFIWTSMPNLRFSSDRQEYKFRSGDKFYKFVDNVLAVRYNNNIDVSSVSLKLYVENPESPLKKILEYAFSRNVQRLTIGWLRREFVIPPSLQLSSKSLKHLVMENIRIDGLSCSSDLPALTTLRLSQVTFKNCSSIIAMCQNVKNLTIENCYVDERQRYDGNDGFTIISSQLLSLTLKRVEWNVDFIHVETPQLKNLIIVDPDWQPDENYCPGGINCISRVTISAPDLTYLRIKGPYLPVLSLDEFRSLEKVDLCISSPQKTHPHMLFVDEQIRSSPEKTHVHILRDLFQRIHSVKALSLSMEIAELLSTSEEVVSHQPSPFPSLKSLEIYPLEGLKTLDILSLWDNPLKYLQMFPNQLDQEQEAMKIKLSAEVANYLLDSSTNATFTMVSYEEARPIKITKAAHRLMAYLWKTLEELETRRAYVKPKKTLANYCREDFTLEVRPLANTEIIFCKLNIIKVVLNMAPASKRVELEARFRRLLSKTKTLVSKIV